MTRKLRFVLAVLAGAIVLDLQEHRRLAAAVVAHATFQRLPTTGQVEDWVQQYLDWQYSLGPKPAWV